MLNALRMAVLSTTVALGALALGPAPASAANAVEVDNEPLGQNCDPCVVEITGESHFNTFGVRIITCRDLLVAEIYHDGSGHVAYSNWTHDAGGSCSRIACNGIGESAAEAESDFLYSEESAPGTVIMGYRFCFDTVNNPNSSGMHCSVPVEVAESGPSHAYTLSVHSLCGGALEMEAAWEISAGDPIEIVHL